MLYPYIPSAVLYFTRHMICQILALFLCGICSAQSIPASPQKTKVTLLVWIEDLQGTFHRERFEEYLKIRQESLSTPLRGVFVGRNKRWSSAFSAMKDSVGQDEEIAGLIIGTHGESSRFLNRAFLERLGSFGWFGTRGPLKYMIQQLAGKWSDSVVIFLDSCATFRGSRRSLGSRTKSLFADFKNVGVKRIAVWGAHLPLTTDGVRSFVPDLDEDNLTRIAAGGFVGALLAGMSAYTYTDNGTYGLVAAAAAWFPSLFITGKMFDHSGPIGSMGSLVAIDDNSIQVLDIDARDPRLKDLTECEKLLTSKHF